MEIYCCECKKVRKCILVTGKEIYPARPELHSLYFWKCPECGQYVGCHKNTQEPMDVIPTQEMKKARQIIHSFMDSMWKSGKITRGKLYRLIAKELGIKVYHTGWTRSLGQCRRVYAAVTKIKKRLGI